ncbi:MAG: B12-binding domain-containing radical SAM protein [Thermoplasmata archaeon]|nr:B12-binding domain-containing radical SAM protein [Thermoplasmata archaeon]MBE3142265.1 B12-binding domain-containing radical SAM protein [Thermoplasmata archaeon]
MDEHTDGYPIVLTASRAEANEFDDNPFAAFICTFPKKLSGLALREHLENLASNKDGTAQRTIYGLRKVESLISEEFGQENVVVAHYDQLHKFIGKNTKIVGISSMDPMGLAYVSTTYNSLIGFGGEALNASEFEKLITHPAIQQYKPKIIVGGAGSWQINEAGMQKKWGIDVLFQGEGEEDLVSVFKKMMNNEPVQSYFVAQKPNRKKIPPITHAACYGMVEITRGCGRGCQFCSPTNRTKYSVPLEYIMNEVKTNINGGTSTIFTVTEDIFLYKSKPGFIPNREAIVKLYKSIASYPGVEHILLSHASLAPVIYDRKLLEELSPILLEKTRWTPELHKSYAKRFVSVEVGIETGSVRLMKKYMKGKALPYSVDNWPELVLQGVGIMNDHDWWPLCTIMTGQPDETEDDVRATLDLIDDLRNHNAKMFYTPVLFIPLKEAVLGNYRRTNLKNLSELQWEVIARCWKNNIDFWSPDRRWLLNPMFFFTHWFYARWKHGKKATVPMMHLAGFPIAQKTDRLCNPEYCQDSFPIGNGRQRSF